MARRAAPGSPDPLRSGRPLHARAHVRRSRRGGARRSRPTPDGRIDLDAVEAECRRGDVGTVVLTLGSTGVGAIDRVEQALALRERYGVRLHIDGAYGGFFTLLAGARRAARRPGAVRGGRVVRLDRRRPAQARPAALRLRRRAVRRSRRRPDLQARVAVHVLHLRRAAPRRDQPGVLAGGRRGRRTLADAAGVPAALRRGLGAMLAGGRRAARAGPAAGRLRAADAAPRARAGHRHVLPVGANAVRGRCAQRRDPAAPA